MSAEKDWLTILAQASSYSDLQNAFDRMSVESKTSVDGDAMVASIDEAIRRIEMERANDQAELEGFSSEYEAFKQQQSGVIGWFKRKLPFTETRKQELEHRDALSDQAAEILADNFIIARAQMLRERVASPKLRRMGQPASSWRNRLLQNDSVGCIREFGSVVYELGKEISVAKHFVDTVLIDIEAFSGAKFIGKEDQLRRNDDLIAGKSELKELIDESREKANLRGSALVTLKNLLVSELSEKDIDFRNTNHRLTLLKNLQEKYPRIAKLMEERLAMVKTVLAKIVERDSLPEQRDKLEKTVSILNRDWEDAEQRRLRAVRELEGPSQLYNAALRESQRAKAALNVAKPLYDAYIAEQNRVAQSAAEVTSDSDFEVSTSNVLTEYRRLEEAASESAQTLRQRMPAFEQTNRNHENAISETKAIRDKSEAHAMDLKKISNLEAELQQQMLRAMQSIESTLPEFRIAIESFLDDANKITESNASGASLRSIQELFDDSIDLILPPSPFSFERSLTNSAVTKSLAEMRRDSERLTHAINALEVDHKECTNKVTALSNLRKEALRARGQILLDQSICFELDLS